MLAPERFALWLSSNHHKDKLGYTYNYHPRSDMHSKALAEFVWADLVKTSPVLKRDFETGRVAYRVNYKYTWPKSHKPKTIDLAIVKPSESGDEVLVSCELKAVMTEHLKSQPRVFDELSSSHEIVHAGDPDALALGVTTVNIASTFASPLRQRQSHPAPLNVTTHRQPHAAESMINHLRGLPQRDGTSGVGFDAYCTFVVSCDNRGTAVLWTDPPAPQPGDKDHYDAFIDRIARAYAERIHPRL